MWKFHFTDEKAEFKNSSEMFCINNHERVFPAIASQALLPYSQNTPHDKHWVNSVYINFLPFYLTPLFLLLPNFQFFNFFIIEFILGGVLGFQKN